MSRQPLRETAASVRRFYFLALACVAAAGCRSMPAPELSLKEARLAEGPVIVQRGERYFLQYRRSIAGTDFVLPAELAASGTADAGYYYFLKPPAQLERGERVERPLASDGFEELARRGRVFWLDPDGTRHPIPVRREAGSGISQ